MMDTATPTDSNELLDDLLGDFLDESAELLQRLNESLLQLDEWLRQLDDEQPSCCDAELLNDMFRAAHSLKGLSAMLGFHDVMDLTHKVENVFDAARNGHLPVNSRFVELVFNSVDSLEAMVEGIKEPGADKRDCGSVLEEIRQLLLDAGVGRDQTNQDEAEGMFHNVMPQSADSDLATESTESPALGCLDAAGKAAKTTVAFQESPVGEEPPARKSSGDSGKKSPATFRVDIERLDTLMNLAGQLVINRARFTQISDALKSVTFTKRGLQSLEKVFGSLRRLAHDVDDHENREDSARNLLRLRRHIDRLRTDLDLVHCTFEQFARMRSPVGHLSEAVHQLQRVSDGIQKTVMETRMVPIGPLFSRFRRVVRDIARDNGKEIALVIRGEKTELDKRMIDELGDPLVHMVRNSADHGIESPDARATAGKPRLGTITLDAFHRGNSIVVQITDDGKGLDPKRIRAKAVQKRIVSAVDAENLSDHQVFQLIWESGFSTAQRVTDVSGRGMGKDIVRTKIDEIGGSVELRSRPGEGTTFTIKLPLTMAILSCLLVDIGGDIFAIPLESVVEIVRVNKQDLTTVHGMQTACLRGKPLSMVELSQLLTWNQTPTATVDRETENAIAVIVRSDRREIGLFVQSPLGEEDVVIKSLADNYENVEGIAGANILGDGRVSLILDVSALIEMSSRSGREERKVSDPETTRDSPAPMTSEARLPHPART